jgi:hypothetical protein
MDHMDENLAEVSTNNDGDGQHVRRGWWDYVPGSEKPPLPSQRVSDAPNSGLFVALRRSIGRLWRSCEDDDLKIAAARKSSLHSESPLPQPSSVRLSENPASPASGRSETARARSPVPSFSSHLVGLRPRMVLLREVMRDEVREHCPFLFVCILMSGFKAMLYYFYNLLMRCCHGCRCRWSQYQDAERSWLADAELYVSRAANTCS